MSHDQAKSCLCCGATFLRKKWEGRWENRKFCSVKCAATVRYQDATGKHVECARAARAIPLGASCQECHATSYLQRHHIDGKRTNNDPSNVMTLCAFCHARWHWEHGKVAKTPTPCSVCGDKAKRNGYCQKHWQRFTKYGDPCLTKTRHGARWELQRA